MVSRTSEVNGPLPLRRRAETGNPARIKRTLSTEGCNLWMARPSGRMFAHALAALAEYERVNNARGHPRRSRGRQSPGPHGRPFEQRQRRARRACARARERGRLAPSDRRQTGLSRAAVGRSLRGEVASLVRAKETEESGD